MRAMVMTRTGGPEVLQEVELSEPQAGADEVLLEVLASSVNPIDCKLRAGQVPALLPELPAILHGDVCGRVLVLGERVQDLQLGDLVFGCAGGLKNIPGALAERMVCDRRLLARLPADSDPGLAAALPLVGITASEMLERAETTAGDLVLVCAGAGGVGNILIQLAVARGARVISTASTPAKQAAALAAGAEAVVDYRQPDAVEELRQLSGGSGFATIFDTVGGENLGFCLRLLARGARLVTCAARGNHDLSPLHGSAGSLHAVFMLLPLLTGVGREAHTQILATLAELFARGRLRPQLDPQRFKLGQAAAAHAHWHSGAAQGKIVCAAW